MTVAIQDGRKVRAALKALGISQKRFCERHFLREATVSEVINGHACDPAILFTIARALDLEQKGAA